MSFLVNLQTDLKSLKYSKDRPDGGYSGQPYVQKEIPNDNNIIPGANDFLIRGGLHLPRAVIDDLERLGKFFIDTKSPNGILFTAKQNLLSRTAVKTQASGKILNAGVYTPLSTLAQAGVNGVGFHLKKQGLNPLTGVTTYEDVARNVIGGEDGGINRLVVLQDSKIATKSSLGGSKFGTIVDGSIRLALQQNQGISFRDNEILAYGGGPTSPLPGIGKTRISIALDNKGAPLRTNTGGKILGIGLPNQENYTTLSSFQINALGNALDNAGSNFLVDFRKTILEEALDTSDLQNLDIDRPKNSSTIMSIAPSYAPSNRKTLDNNTGNSRINYTSPGTPGNILNYSKGKVLNGISGSIVDKINAYPIYSSTEKRTTDDVNDLIDFVIGVYDPYSRNDSGQFTKEWIHFRAYIDSFNDAYSGNWNSTKYMGRPEEMFNYTGFKRKISLGFTVAAQSKPELIKQYKKLNFLASTLAPTISEKGYMSGTMISLTMGGWCSNLTGFVDALTLNVPQESPWEIGIDTEGNKDATTSQLPHIVRVEGFSFTPIHSFVPQKAKLDLDDNNSTEQRYISIESSDRTPNNTNKLWGSGV